ncbi:hypothetical protein DID96_18225 [Burkholderia sp. Bp8963]|nr:hypothetical protein DID96_18225 [Burkholderia sp. Bp8963]
MIGGTSKKRPNGRTAIRFSPHRHIHVAVRLRQIAVLTFFYTNNIATHHRRVYSWNCLLHVSS